MKALAMFYVLIWVAGPLEIIVVLLKALWIVCIYYFMCIHENKTNVEVQLWKGKWWTSEWAVCLIS